LAAIVIGASFSNLFLTVALYSAASLLGYLAYIVVMSRMTRVSIWRFWVPFTMNLGYSLLAISPLAFVLFSDFASSNAPIVVAIIISASFFLMHYVALARQHT